MIVRKTKLFLTEVTRTFDNKVLHYNRKQLLQIIQRSRWLLTYLICVARFRLVTLTVTLLFSVFDAKITVDDFFLG